MMEKWNEPLSLLSVKINVDLTTLFLCEDLFLKCEIYINFI